MSSLRWMSGGRSSAQRFRCMVRQHMSTIATEQNTDDNLRLLCAAGYIYSRAKSFRAWHTSFVIAFALLAAVFIFTPDKVKVAIFVVSCIVTLIGVCAEQYE